MDPVLPMLVFWALVAIVVALVVRRKFRHPQE